MIARESQRDGYRLYFLAWPPKKSQPLRSRASGVSKDEAITGGSWFETALTRLLTMRVLTQ